MEFFSNCAVEKCDFAPSVTPSKAWKQIGCNFEPANLPVAPWSQKPTFAIDLMINFNRELNEEFF